MMDVCGYARVSTAGQELDLQIDALKKFCASKGLNLKYIYKDIGSGATFFKREDFMRMQKDLYEGIYQGVVVFRLDRLGRNMREMVNFMADLESKKINVFSINESFDTTSAMGRAILGFMLVLAQLEREMISEATKQRLQGIKDSGKPLGRPKGSRDTKKRDRYGYFKAWNLRRQNEKAMKKGKDEKSNE